MSRTRLLIAVVGAMAALSAGPSAVADCAAPDISVSPRIVSPGDELSIVGRSWGDACNDTQGPGCDSPPLGEPIREIHLQLQNQRTSETFDLLTVDADDYYHIEASAEVPQVPAGRYKIVDVRGEGYFTGKPLRVIIAD